MEQQLEAARSLREASRDSGSYHLTVAEMLPVPAVEARLYVAPEAIDSIPTGHALSRREGRATASLGRTPEGTVVVTATCDSLTRVVLLYEEAYSLLSDRYAQLTDSLRSTSEALTQAERKRTKPPEWLWIGIAFLLGVFLGGAAVNAWKL